METVDIKRMPDPRKAQWPQLLENRSMKQNETKAFVLQEFDGFYQSVKTKGQHKMRYMKQPRPSQTYRR